MAKITVPNLETHKVVNDPVHGYIFLTRLEYEIIQLPLFNRLHDLKQMSMAYLVFPGAITTRFQHSVGAMHVSSKIISQLLQTLEQDEFAEIFPSHNSELKRAGLMQTIRLAALLHDLGHGPFSHSMEYIMRASLKEKHSTEFKEACDLLSSEPSKLPVHEYYSYKMILKSEISDVIDDDKFRKNQDGRIMPVSKVDVANLLVKTPKNGGSISSKGLSILHKVISGQLDADRMDYLRRDSYMAGVPYGVVDPDRVVMNMIVRKDKVGTYELAVHERALGAIEDMLDARFKMYKWVYSHHMVVNADELLKLAVADLVDDDILKPDDFYWKRICSDLTTDTSIMNSIRQLASKSTASLCNHLVDRRYLPVSLLKRPTDHIVFQIEIQNALGKEIGLDVIKEKISKFFVLLRDDPSLEIRGEESRILGIPVSHSPYNPIHKEDTVWLCSDRDETLVELTKASEYFNAINREWQSFPSYYVSYIIPGMKKQEASGHREEVRKKILQQIAAA